MYQEIRETFELLQNPSQSEKMKKYMKDRFEFFGISSPDRKTISKPIILELLTQKSIDEALVIQLWEAPERELQYLALDYLIKAKKYWMDDMWPIWSYLITHKSWWDTVDSIATNLVGVYAQRDWQYHKKYLSTFIYHNDMWMNRTAIISQLKYNKSLDTTFLAEAILAHHTEREFFIAKAIGWALRQYGKCNPQWVIDFIDHNTLQPLSIREAKKYLL